jgi:hypothetical protein
MKLSLAQAEHVLDHIEGQIVPENHEVTPQLTSLFGEHTFFLNADGLSIVEPSADDSEIGNVVKLASWTDDKRTMLAPHPPEATAVEVVLGVPGDEED